MKKILVMILMLAPMSIFAQKFAHFDMSQILPEMEEYKTVSAELEKIQQQYQNEMEAIQKEYQTKVEEYKKLDAEGNTAQAILQSKLTDIQKIEERLQDFYQASQQELQKKQQEMQEPIYAKVIAAIKKIGEVGNYVYVMEASSVIFINTSLSTDVTAQIKAELGIK